MIEKPTIYLGTDHRGFSLKEKIKLWLSEWGYKYEDKGAFAYNKEDDYPDFIIPVARAVAEEPLRRLGIVLGGSGQGEVMAANRFKGVRAALYYGGAQEVARMSREHNGANVLSLGADFVGEKEAKEALKMWLETPFSGEERHVRRINKIDN